MHQCVSELSCFLMEVTMTTDIYYLVLHVQIVDVESQGMWLFWSWKTWESQEMLSFYSSDTVDSSKLGPHYIFAFQLGRNIMPSICNCLQIVYCIVFFVSYQRDKGSQRSNAGVQAPYLHVLGIYMDSEKSGFSSSSIPISTEEEELFRRLASSPNVFDRIAKSIAPSIFGFEDIKKAIACLLFGGKP